jgi:hypothetical protein
LGFDGFDFDEDVCERFFEPLERFVPTIASDSRYPELLN